MLPLLQLCCLGWTTPCMPLSLAHASHLWRLQHPWDFTETQAAPSQLHAVASQGPQPIAFSLWLQYFHTLRSVVGSLEPQRIISWSLHFCIFHASKASTTWLTFINSDACFRWALTPLDHSKDSFYMLSRKRKPDRLSFVSRNFS